ncbi:MAG TPA: acyl-CoA dehydrogenase family protein, partial [Nitriliruptorales bacterium]|nr:acyl-CoA dehydrogenase family protein [Nitriliruptorales bacterium]
VASEALEAFGGAGYVEDTHLPVLLRDAQVLPIWEGTTNVLSLDVLRALQRDAAPERDGLRQLGGALEPYLQDVRRHARRATHPALTPVVERALAAADHAAAWLEEAVAMGDADVLAHGARRFAVTLGRAMQAALLAAQGQHDLDVGGDGRGVAVARRFAAQRLNVLEPPGRDRASDAALARDEPLPPL